MQHNNSNPQLYKQEAYINNFRSSEARKLTSISSLQQMARVNH